MATPQLWNRLRLWRADAGFSLDELSDLTGVSKAMLSRVERGEREFSARTKVRVARRLGASVRDLFEVAPIEDEPTAGRAKGSRRRKDRHKAVAS